MSDTQKYSCPWCTRKVAGRIPKGGDGSVLVYYSHVGSGCSNAYRIRGMPFARCAGSGEEIKKALDVRQSSPQENEL